MARNGVRKSLGAGLALAICAVFVPAGASSAAALDRIAWKPCGERLQCANVGVPLDWHRPAGRKIQLAVIRHLASRPDKRIGTFFFNPGGPGSPGLEVLKDPSSAGLLDAAGDGRFDIISWDPRGVGASTRVRCFTQRTGTRRGSGETLTDPDHDARPPAVTSARPLAYARRCGDAQRRAARPHLHRRHGPRSRPPEDAGRRTEADHYVGWSYGTFLGQTYANVYPNRVRAHGARRRGRRRTLRHEPGELSRQRRLRLPDRSSRSSSRCARPRARSTSTPTASRGRRAGRRGSSQGARRPALAEDLSRTDPGPLGGLPGPPHLQQAADLDLPAAQEPRRLAGLGRGPRRGRARRRVGPRERCQRQSSRRRRRSRTGVDRLCRQPCSPAPRRLAERDRPPLCHEPDRRTGARLVALGAVRSVRRPRAPSATPGPGTRPPSTRSWSSGPRTTRTRPTPTPASPRSASATPSC